MYKNRKWYKLICGTVLFIIGLLFIDPLNDIANNILSSLHITKKCYKEDGGDFIRIFKQEGLDYYKEDQKITSNSLNLLYIESKPIDTIPKISHHIYISFKTNPVLPNEIIIEMLKSSLNKLNSTAEWQHYLWTNIPDLFKEIVKDIKNISLKTIDEFHDHPLYNTLTKALERNRISSFSQASDVLRLMALEQYGGLYFDLDYEIYNAIYLSQLIKKFDFIIGRERKEVQSYYGNAFLASKPNHPIIKDMITLTLRNGNIENSKPEYVQYPCTTGHHIIFNGPPLATVAYFRKNNINGNKDLLLPSWMLFNFKLAREKNHGCNYENLTKENFILKNANLNQLLNLYSLSIKDNKDANIYYSHRDKDKFTIIGADMLCGTWFKNKKYLYYF